MCGIFYTTLESTVLKNACIPQKNYYYHLDNCNKLMLLGFAIKCLQKSKLSFILSTGGKFYWLATEEKSFNLMTTRLHDICSLLRSMLNIYRKKGLMISKFSFSVLNLNPCVETYVQQLPAFNLI